MPYATKITGSDNTVYDIKDVEARRNRVFRGTCDTAAGTATKVVTVDSDFTLAVGREIAVKFSSANTAANPKLNVNSTGAISIYYQDDTIRNNVNVLSQNDYYTFFVYDGSNWVWAGQNTNNRLVVTMTGTVDPVNDGSLIISNPSHTITQITNALTTNTEVLIGLNCTDISSSTVFLRCMNGGEYEWGVDYFGLTIMIWYDTTPSTTGWVCEYNELWNHEHGTIGNQGESNSYAIVANGDSIVFTDNSDNDKIKKSNLAFDTTATTKFLRCDGTWATPEGGGNDIHVRQNKFSGTQKTILPILTQTNFTNTTITDEAAFFSDIYVDYSSGATPQGAIHAPYFVGDGRYLSGLPNPSLGMPPVSFSLLSNNAQSVIFDTWHSYQLVDVSGSTHTFTISIPSNNTFVNYLLVSNSGNSTCTITLQAASGMSWQGFIRPTDAIEVEPDEYIELSFISIDSHQELVITKSAPLERASIS